MCGWMCVGYVWVFVRVGVWGICVGVWGICVGVCGICVGVCEGGWVDVCMLGVSDALKYLLGVRENSV